MQISGKIAVLSSLPSREGNTPLHPSQEGIFPLAWLSMTRRGEGAEVYQFIDRLYLNVAYNGRHICLPLYATNVFILSD
jgi:hypothetical protein